MKQIKVFSMMLLLATMFVGFNACSSDDDDDLKPEDEKKRIAKIVNEYDDYIRTETFSYSNGKMSKYTAKYTEDTGDEFDQTITYSNNTITLTGLLDSEEATQIYTLNNNGLAISCKIIYKDETVIDYNYTFQYSDGYLIGVSQSSEYTEIFTLTNSNGNITKVTETHDDGDVYNYTFDYSNNENKNIINPFIEEIEILFVHKPAYYMGILGKSTKNLAISSTETSQWGSENSTCVYALDNDNYVKTATLSNGDKFTYTFE